MIKNIILLLATLIIKTAIASCGGPHIFIYPKCSSISTNSIFLIDFPEQKYKYSFKKNSFYILTENGKRIKLKILEINYTGSCGQILLKPSKNLRVGDSVSIKVYLPSNTDSSLAVSFKTPIENKKWLVIYKADNEAPKWETDSINYTIQDYRESTGGLIGFRFNCPVSDNLLSIFTYEENGAKFHPILYEMTLEGKKYIIPANNFEPMLSWGDCGSVFGNLTGRTHTISIRPLDNSGNYSTSKKATFTFPK